MQIQQRLTAVFKLAGQGIVILILSLLLAEIAFRIYHHFNPLYIFYSDSYNRFRSKPFSTHWGFKLNSQGFKDVEFTPKQADIYRIVALGDSFAFGVVPYQYNYLTRLETQLQAQFPKLEILNMGIPDTGPKDYLSVLVKEALPLAPDMVLLSLFIGNDLHGNEQEHKRWYDHSYVATFLVYLATIHPKYEGNVYNTPSTYCDTCPTFDEETFLQVEKDRSVLFLKDFMAVMDLVENTVQYLAQIADICNNKGIPLLIVILPDELQVNSQLQHAVRNRYTPPIQDAGWDITQPNRWLIEKLTVLDIAYLDLYPDFAAQDGTLYRRYDTHWNIQGNQLAADLIQRVVQGSFLRLY